MGCTKNYKSFFGIKYEGPHEDEIIDVGVFMAYVSNEYRTTERCKLCGRINRRHFVSQDELLHQGFSLEYLEEQRSHVI